ncbi:hypothetical protein CCR79_11310 [Halorhodospira halophila]|nr:hypothetical protein [Halorhodospira halophila]
MTSGWWASWGGARLSLRALLAVMVVSVALGTFLATASVTLFIHESLIRDHAERTAEATAEHTFSSMFQVMSRGWGREDLEAYIDALEATYDDSPLGVALYRGDPVEALYGPVEGSREPDPVIEQALATGESQHRRDGTRQRHVMPVVAQSECLDCHVNADSGDVLGVVAVKQDLSPQLSEARAGFGWLFLIFVPLTLLAGAAAAHWLNVHLTRSLERFSAQVERVNAIGDLEDFQPRTISLGFSELNRVMHQVDALIRRLQTVAADKAVLDAHQAQLDEEQETAQRIVARATASAAREAPGVRYAYQPAAMLGGDVFLAERRPDGTLVLLLGDFTGHGIGSAVGVPALAALFYDMVRRGLDSEALLETVNDRLYRNLPPEMFLAAALFEIDCRERRLGVWSGGMPRAWLLGPGGGETRLDAEGLPLAAVPGGAVEHRRLAYHPLFAGARLIACSDGLTEMASPAGVRYGEERVEALLAHTRPGEAFDALLADVAAWRGDSEAGDDLTLLGVSFDELFAEAAEGCPRASAPSA